MAQPATNPKIEELRFKVKTDPKSRLFYPLAEELRKVGQHAEAEQVLRGGLNHHATYLSAWVGLGRVLRDQQKDAEAVEALKKALQLDPGNVVAARLMADAYLALGEKVEAIKKYKLVFAQLSGDEELESIINRLDTEINQRGVVALSAPFEEDYAQPEAEQPLPPTPPPPPPSSPHAVSPTHEPVAGEDSVFDVTYSRLRSGIHVGEDTSPLPQKTGDAEPMGAHHEESPFEESGTDSGYGSDAFAVEQPGGMHVSDAPLPSDVTRAFGDDPFAPAPETDPFAIDDEPAAREDFERGVAPGFVTDAFSSNIAPPPPDPDDFARTITMADLYANQGLIDEARDIYEDLLLRDPSNASLRAKLDALESAQPAPREIEEEESPAESRETEAPAPAPMAAAGTRQNPRVVKLQTWLSKVARKEGGRV